MNMFKDILVHLNSRATAASVLQTSLLVAKKFYGHLDAFHVHLEPSCILPVPVVSADMAGFVVSDVVQAEEKAFAANADEMRAAFETFVAEHGVLVREDPQPELKEVTARFREIFGSEEEVIAWCSRVADLTVLGRPDPDVPASGDGLSVLNAALMESGSAILIAPRQAPESIGNRVMIAWDATEEAAKAVTLAMPFLVTAQEVAILETDQPNDEWAGAQALADRLAWHGIKAETVKMPEASSVAVRGTEIVRQACGRFDLLVSGAFTQNTMRRWILGSMTKYLIDNADIALLMTH